ncbi:MAG: carboxypeptidase regulatory-like domain-containing protein [Candidatus Latescibacteria bacterium]|nr:carboxypeptidase regulatory-like domain-containing protein [Candidatus Latescibacterota bacterium]
MSLKSACLWLLVGALAISGCEKPTPPKKAITTISGRVTDAETGKPVVGALITTEPATQQVTTDGEGRFAIQVGVEEGVTYRVNASKSGYFSNFATVKVVEGENRVADIQLCRIIVGIAGTVTDATTGQPIEGAEITTDPVSQSITTDSNGRYVLDNLTKDVEYRVTAYKQGYERKTITVKVIADKKYQRGDIQLSPIEPVLDVSPEGLNFRKDQNSLTLIVTNSGTGTLEWSVGDYPDWISVSPSAGTTRRERDQVTVTVDRSKLPSGTYSGSLTVRSNGGDKQISITVEWPRLQVDVSVLDFGTLVTELYFNITNVGTGTLDWQVSEDLDWLSLTPTSGSITTETAQVKVKVSREGHSVKDSPYSGQIQISSIYAGSATVDVTMEVPEPDTKIVSGPSDREMVQTLPVVFVFEGVGIEGTVQFSWRLNIGGVEGNWSEWSKQIQVSLDGLDESSLVGGYHFQVRSRSAAGDVDSTPASRRFTVDAIQGPALWLTPRKLQTASGSEFQLQIVAEEVADLMLAHLVVKFDSSKLELVSVEPEEAFFKKNGGTLVWPQPRLGPGFVDISAGVALGSPPGVSGTGTIGLLRFKAKAPGTTQVEFNQEKTELRDHSNQQIELRKLVESRVLIQ